MSTNNPSSLVLFVSVIIIDTPRHPSAHFQRLTESELAGIRSNISIYRCQSKIDIFKYMLSSLACVQWEGIYLDIEVDSSFGRDSVEDLRTFAKSIFGERVDFGDQRCTTRKQYIARIRYIQQRHRDSFIFYSPNHDHILMAPDLGPLHSAVEFARSLRDQTSCPTRICYSHQMESLLASDQRSPFYNKNLLGGICILDNENYRVVKREQYAWDSFYIAHIDDMYAYFCMSEITDAIYAPRGEDFYPYPFPSIENIAIIPKQIICNHYDGYFHFFRGTPFTVNNLDLFAPPLFIPPGFFTKSMKLRYGYRNCTLDAVTIHPNPDCLSFNSANQTKSSVISDFKGRLCDIPFFWRDYISNINVHESFSQSDIYAKPSSVLAESFLFSLQSDAAASKNDMPRFGTPKRLSLTYDDLPDLSNKLIFLLGRVQELSK